MEVVNKPLGGKAYGHIPHLPGSRMGSGDHHCDPGQARMACEQAKSKKDVVVVQEKVDGTCVSAAKLNGQIVPLVRAGYIATKSPYEQHHLWALWVRRNEERFQSLLGEGERVCGEWLAQAHSTRYDLTGREPFVAFDIMEAKVRLPYQKFFNGASANGFTVPQLISYGPPRSIEYAMLWLTAHGSGHGAIDPIEGAVWRVETGGKVNFLCKYVRPEKKDGIYLPEKSGKDEIWNWRPTGTL